jgi:subtilisin family serine protease
LIIQGLLKPSIFHLARFKIEIMTTSRSKIIPSRDGRQIHSSNDRNAQEVKELHNRHYTGRYIVIFADVPSKQIVTSLEQGSGLRVASSSDFDSRAIERPSDSGNSAMYFEALGIAVVDAHPEQLQKVRVAAANGMLVIPERYMYSAGMLQLDRAYLTGYRDGVNATLDQLLRIEGGQPSTPISNVRPQGLDAATSGLTWNLSASGVGNSSFLGRGVKIAVLDTGYDLTHPDFKKHSIESHCFVPDSTMQDVFGHGTHCLGIACGMSVPVSAGPRYGCASEAEILIGKVLGDNGIGDEGCLLNGINWALERGADIVSLSIEGPYDAASPILPQYEAAGSKALGAGRLIVAAAGNSSARPLFTRPVASPACASTIFGVAAIGPDDKVASFSCAGGPGGGVDIAAPGISIESSFPVPRVRKVESGTSMAAPLVAGIAALYKESDSRLQGQGLWDRVVKSARALQEGPQDVGAGCVMAP